MKKSVSIKNFGPLKDTTLSLDRTLQVFIGPQASGKSTLGKVVFFCRRIRDYLSDFANDIWNHRVSGDLYSSFLKSLKNPFIGCFGTTKHMDKFVIRYTYNEEAKKTVTIKLDDAKFVSFTFSASLREPVKKLLDEAKQISDKRSGLFADDFQNQQSFLALFQQEAYKLFEDDAKLLYIPAGRNMLATIPDMIMPSASSQERILQQTDISQTDLFTQSFIRYIKRMQYRFGSRLDEIAENYAKTVTGELRYRDVELACGLIKTILKADYVYDRDGEKLYYGENKWIKLMFGSSGQQEVLWALNCIFLAILQKEKTFLVFEEPESHIFPDSQVVIMQLVALLINSTKSEVFLTTHSPYILTATNLLLYSGQVEQGNESPVVIQKFRLKPNTVDAYMLHSNGNKLHHLMDEEHSLIEAIEIDHVSDTINKKMDKIMTIEVSREVQNEQ